MAPIATTAQAASAAPDGAGYVVAWGDAGYGQTMVPKGLRDVIAVAAGSTHALALRVDGTVVAWGSNDGGETTVPKKLRRVSAVAAGGAYSLALRSDGTVVSWGEGWSGNANRAGLRPPPDLAKVTAIAAGHDHALALRSDGTVAAWGDNGTGQLDVPAGLRDVTAVAAGYGFSVALLADGTTVRWGRNPEIDFLVTPFAVNIDQDPRRLDQIRTNYSRYNQAVNVANAAGLNGRAVALDGHFDRAIAVRPDGTVTVTGARDNAAYYVPPGLTNVTAVSAGKFHNLALRADGTVAAWGGRFAFGRGIEDEDGVTAIPRGLRDVIAIASGDTFNLAITTTPSG